MEVESQSKLLTAKDVAEAFAAAAHWSLSIALSDRAQDAQPAIVATSAGRLEIQNEGCKNDDDEAANKTATSSIGLMS